MNYNKKSVKDVNVSGKRVVLRCDFNVPLDKQTGGITSDKRILASLPTIRYLLDNGARVIACSHLGKPKGKASAELSLAPVAKRLSELLALDVKFAEDVAGEDSKKKADALCDGEIMLLENLRFEIGETKNDPEFAKRLASMGEIYVSDAFGTVHRAHASTVGVAAYLPVYAGLLIERELRVMGGALKNPKRPFMAILGGAKVSDKIGVITNLLNRVDTIIIGGGMSFTFLKAMGMEVGASLLEGDKLELADEIMKKARDKSVTFLLPVDFAVGDSFSPECEKRIVEATDIPAGWMGMDIGPKTAEIYKDEINKAGTVVWNGPMGVFEFPAFAEGTEKVARALAESKAITIVGGGDSAAAVEQLGYQDKITHISTGGGATLNLLEGKELPGVACVLNK